MQHPNHLTKYQGSIEELVSELGNLRYDNLVDFLNKMGDDLMRQAARDREKGRVQLVSQLEAAAQKLYEARDKMQCAWKISEPYMKYD